VKPVTGSTRRAIKAERSIAHAEQRNRTERHWIAVAALKLGLTNQVRGKRMKEQFGTKRHHSIQSIIAIGTSI